MHIIPDLGPSLAMTLPFFVAFFGLWLILWNPLMQFLEGREEATAGARSEAEQLTLQAEQRTDTLEARLAVAHAEVVDLLAAARARALANEGEIVAVARGVAEGLVAEAQTRIAVEKIAARTELESSVSTLSEDIVTRLLA